jgi:hypothetical protein
MALKYTDCAGHVMEDAGEPVMSASFFNFWKEPVPVVA